MDRMKQEGEEMESSKTGRWTTEEHDLFIRGLHQYGKDWKQIGSLIKTRTVVQIRTHAQKYFLASKKHDDSPHLSLLSKSKDKKRAHANQSSTTRNKKRRDDEKLDHLDRIFDLVDASSSGSDEGTPTAVDELEFLRTSFSSGFVDDKEPIETMQLPPPIPVHREPGNAQPVTYVPYPPVSKPSTMQAEGAPTELPDITATFDPLPPTIEFGFIGRWMDAIPSINDSQ